MSIVILKKVITWSYVHKSGYTLLYIDSIGKYAKLSAGFL